MVGLPFGDQILIKDADYMYYSRNRKRKILKNDIFFRLYYKVGDTSHLYNYLYNYLQHFWTPYIVYPANILANHILCLKNDANLLFQQLRKLYEFVYNNVK